MVAIIALQSPNTSNTLNKLEISNLVTTKSPNVTPETKVENLSASITVLEDHSVADILFDKVRVLCWILTNPENHMTKAIHVKRTWGKRCNRILFMSSANDAELGTIALPVIEGRDYLWWKTKEAFKYIHQHYLDEADWFLKADDDTYLATISLNYFLI